MQNNDLAFFGGSTTSFTKTVRSWWAVLLGEERPGNILVLLAILVLLLHIWLLTWLIRPIEKVTEAVPLVMEVSMIAIAAPKPVAAPPKPVPPPPPATKPTPPKKTPLKPVIKKPAPVVQKAPDFAPSEPVEPAPAPQQTTQATSTSNTSAATSASQAISPSSSETFTEANFRANYAHNPKPEYPAIAKNRGWQGKVLLRVNVSAQGTSDAVTVEQSSGREILDESAIEAVKKWRFIPAKRGETPVASSVIVPIVFTLRN